MCVPRLPLPGETLLASDTLRDLGGKGLNQAVAAQRAGADVTLIAPIGNDSVADDVMAMLKRENMPFHGLLTRSGSSDHSIVLRAEDGENVIVSYAGLVQGLGADEATAQVAAQSTGAVLMQGNTTFDTTLAVARAARTRGLPVIINAAPFQDGFAELANYVDVVVLNEPEAMQWTGRANTRDAVQAIGSAVAVVTGGSRGCQVSLAGGPPMMIDAPRVTAVDTTGAGDVFVGTFVAQWLRAGDAIHAARLGVLAASDKVTRAGTLSAFPTGTVIDRLRLLVEASR